MSGPGYAPSTIQTPREVDTPYHKQVRRDDLARNKELYQYGPKPDLKANTRPGRGPALNMMELLHNRNVIPEQERGTRGTGVLLTQLTPRLYPYQMVDQMRFAYENSAKRVASMVPWFLRSKPPPLPPLEQYYMGAFDSFLWYTKDYKAQIPNGGNTLDDEAFANQQLNGYAPYWIAKVKTSLPEGSVITEESVAAFLRPKSLTLASLIESGDLYMVNLMWMAPALFNIKQKEVRDQGKGLRAAPLALFYVDKKVNKLMPLAIQQLPKDCRPFGREEPNPVLTPADEPSVWTVAKLFVNNSCFFAHTGIIHYNGSWWTSGPIVAMRRTLHESHPLSAMTIAFFEMALGKWPFFEVQHWMDPTCHQYPAIMFPYFENFVYNRDFHELNNIKERDVDDIPHYHWRDDTKTVYPCFERLAQAVVDKAYETDDDLLKDKEVQAFAREVADECFIPGLEFAASRSFTSKKQVVDFLAPLMYFNTVKFSYNTVAWPYYVYQLSTPTYFNMYPLRSNKTPISLEAIYEAMPPRCADSVSMTRTGILATNWCMLKNARLTTGGPNAHRIPEMPHWLGDPRYVGIRQQWFQDLNDAEHAINQRNEALVERREAPFTYMLPSLQSTAIWY